MAVLEWYRVDQSRRIRRVLVAGAALLTLGGVVVGGAFLTRQSVDVRNTAVLVGLALTVAGALRTVTGMWGALAVDSVLIVKSDGVEIAIAGKPIAIAWGELARVRFDEARAAIVFERRDEGEPTILEPAFASIERAALAKRLDELRRKAEFGLL